MSSPMDERSGKSVYLHVGAPAAGTAFLPRALWANRRRLGDAGVCYPLAGPQEHFAAVMDLREMSWGGRRDPDWDGAWDRVVRRIRDWDGHAAVFSEGLLAGATEGQVRRVVDALAPAEVHVVYASHDLGWQLVLDWQEQLRHAHTVTFERFVDDLVARGIDAPEPFGEMFWGLHDPVRVLGTWASAVPEQRIHVLTLPPPDGTPRVLWDRFRAVTGIGAEVCDIEGITAGGPLSAVDAELLRRLNGKIGPALRGDYERMIREYLPGHGPAGASRAGGAEGRTRMGLPARHNEWAAKRTRELAASLRASGYDVAGDLGELTTAPDPGPCLLPGDVPEELIATASVGVVAHLLEELTLAHERIGLAHLHSEMAGVQDNLRRLLEVAAAPSPPLQRAARRATGKRNP